MCSLNGSVLSVPLEGVAEVVCKQNHILKNMLGNGFALSTVNIIVSFSQCVCVAFFQKSESVHGCDRFSS